MGSEHRILPGFIGRRATAVFDFLFLHFLSSAVFFILDRLQNLFCALSHLLLLLLLLLLLVLVLLLLLFLFLLLLLLILLLLLFLILVLVLFLLLLLKLGDAQVLTCFQIIGILTERTFILGDCSCLSTLP